MISWQLLLNTTGRREIWMISQCLKSLSKTGIHAWLPLRFGFLESSPLMWLASGSSSLIATITGEALLSPPHPLPWLIILVALLYSMDQKPLCQ